MLIPPSLRYLLTVATHRHPRYLLRILNSFDEIYALFMLAVERHFLKTYGGGFTENFYGLKRERVLRIKGGDAPRARIGASNLMRETLKLRDRDIWNNLAIMVGLPYLKRKLDESYEIHAPQVTILGPSYNPDSRGHDASLRQRIMYYYKWFLRKIYPSLNATYYFSLIIFNLAYLFDNSKYSSPFLWLIGTRIRRLSEADYHAIALATEASAKTASRPRTEPGQGASAFNLATFASTLYPRLVSSLKILLPASIFALKFLEWWHASDFARQLSKKAIEGLDIPPPVVSGLSIKPSVSSGKAQIPASNLRTTAVNTVSLSSHVPPSHDLNIDLQSHSRIPSMRKRQTPPISATNNLPIHTVSAPLPSTLALCPICLHPIQTPTSAQTGYVFCYTCIFKWVDGSHERQTAFMEGKSGGDGAWDDDDGLGEVEDDEDDSAAEKAKGEVKAKTSSSREGKWDSGKGRCAVTGRRVLGGTDGLRRIMV